ncbi:39S ribosomal protein L48, mitochondrial [Conger conger]|uniref:39S ribosomal protein L48, mitochondrial n=1 Tax=Conger conger TaxID=82655 RepID=UPI002A5ABE46|nr:39S ribosomal protein L48, mitochondrial [Conger conger]
MSLPTKFAFAQRALVLDLAASIFRPSVLKQDSLLGTLSANARPYRSMPTHGIGRYKNLLPPEVAKKRKERIQMKPIKAATEFEYGDLNVAVFGYDMTLVEHYSQYIHNLCNRLKIKVGESYALPTKSTEIFSMQDIGAKMSVDAVLKTHRRVVQLSGLNATVCPVFIEVLLKNLPEGVDLTISEHTEEDFSSRMKTRPELEELMAKMNS